MEEIGFFRVLMGPKAPKAHLRRKKIGRRAAEAGVEEEDSPKRGVVRGRGNKREDNGVDGQGGWAIVFRMVKGQVAEKAAFVFEPIGMVVEGPRERKEDKAEG